MIRLQGGCSVHRRRGMGLVRVMPVAVAAVGAIPSIGAGLAVMVVGAARLAAVSEGSTAEVADGGCLLLQRS